MLKILLKSAVLLFIVISVYIIVNPTACSNMLAGRERADQTQAVANPDKGSMAEQKQDVRTPQRPASTDAEEMFSNESTTPVQGIIDTNTLKEMAPQPTYSQQDIDYAIASRYVELEREYARNHTVGKDTSREISFIVMDDFEMSPAEWESFLSRATATDLFEKVRKELPHTESK